MVTLKMIVNFHFAYNRKITLQTRHIIDIKCSLRVSYEWTNKCLYVRVIITKQIRGNLMCPEKNKP